jgi:hypothetical protein
MQSKILISYIYGTLLWTESVGYRSSNPAHAISPLSSPHDYSMRLGTPFLQQPIMLAASNRQPGMFALIYNSVVAAAIEISEF